MKLKGAKINAPKIIAFSFLSVIIIGTILLSFPFSTTASGCISTIDALFTATSAVCVTGLIVVDTGTYFTPFGQLVILILIQIGGLGIMTLSTFFLILLGKRLQMKDLFVIEGTLGKEMVYGVKGLVKYILFVTLSFEFIGAGILFWRFISYADYPVLKALYHAIFHSVSAFCNAGFSLYSDSLTKFRGDWIIVTVMAFLIVCGGLGFVVLLNLNTYKFWRRDKVARGRLKFQTKVVLALTAILLVFGVLSILALEWNQCLGGLSIKEKLVSASFHAVTPRTAGFNVVSIANMSLASLCLMLFLMFIGASPGSTGGGIKTSTFMVLFANARSIVKGETEVHLFNRTIPKRIIQEATCIIGISMSLIFVFSMGLLISEGYRWGLATTKSGFIKIIFEIVSAFSNVGLSTGITPSLSSIGKFIIIVTMFIGRISPLAMALIIGRRAEAPAVGYPMETVMVG